MSSNFGKLEMLTFIVKLDKPKITIRFWPKVDYSQGIHYSATVYTCCNFLRQYEPQLGTKY